MNTNSRRRRGRKLSPGRIVSSEARYHTVRCLRTRVPNTIADRIDAIPGGSQYAKVRKLVCLGLEAYEAKNRMPKQ